MLLIKDSSKPSYRSTIVDRMKPLLKAAGWQVYFCGYDLEKIESRIRARNIDVLFSISFYPRCSYLASTLQCHYVCWDFDKIINPDLFHPQFFSPSTLFLSTYREDVFKMRDLGYHAEVLPACPAFLLDIGQMGEGDVANAQAIDISFVGSSVSSITNSFLDLKKQILNSGATNSSSSNELWRLVQSVLEEQRELSKRGLFRLRELIEEHLFTSSFKGVLDVDSLFNPLAKESSRIQRNLFLSKLCEFQVSVFGPEDWQEVDLPFLSYGGYANYDFEAPKIFMNSRINVNIARSYALDGMSDRVFNVLAAGGFLVTNETETMKDCFDFGKDLVVVKTPEELREACRYYMEHEAERVQIAENGKRRLNTDHRLKNRFDQILGFCRKYGLIP